MTRRPFLPTPVRPTDARRTDARGTGARGRRTRAAAKRARERTVLLPETREDLARDLEAVEASLVAVCSEDGTRSEQAARDVLLGGGKRARPLLTCAVLRALGQDPFPHIHVIAAIELAHTGSLLHDDILDGAHLRRGRRAAHVAHDVPTAILGGDWLLITAVELVSRGAPAELRARFLASLHDVCRGEALERERLFDATVDAAHTHRVNRLKTASLFAYAAEAGALLAGAPAAVGTAARAYGLALGEAFQLTDDLLDFVGDPEVLGKPGGGDLLAGEVTLPVALAWERDPSLRESVLAVWRAARGDAVDPADAAAAGAAANVALRALRKRLEDAGAFALAREQAVALATAACAALDAFPPGAWRDQLAVLAHAAVARAE